MKMCWETQLRLALLSTGFMSLLSSTCHSVEEDNYGRLILAAHFGEELAEPRVFLFTGWG